MLPISPCPACGYITDAATLMNPELDLLPNPGDFSICIKCKETLVFDNDLKLREPTTEELNEMSEEDADQIALTKWFLMHIQLTEGKE
jgi:hypothetical protein